MLIRSFWTAALAAAVMSFAAPATSAPKIVAFDAEVSPGTIVVKTSERRLYVALGNGEALRYPVAVGKLGKQWAGEATIVGKHVAPAWSPPEEIRQDNPSLPEVIPGGAAENPMGVAALTLSGGQYAIHGTNRPSSIGTDASYGCIRMFNDDIQDLFERVGVGTPVIVTP
jgi:lipoprotein-anchoring transpeptidase ErfK/SrfK